MEIKNLSPAFFANMIRETATLLILFYENVIPFECKSSVKYFKIKAVFENIFNCAQCTTNRSPVLVIYI